MTLTHCKERHIHTRTYIHGNTRTYLGLLYFNEKHFKFVRIPINLVTRVRKVDIEYCSPVIIMLVYYVSSFICIRYFMSLCKQMDS